MLTMLVVDDEKIERDGIRFLVRKYGLPLHVEEAANGEKALALLQRSPVDIVLTDIKMPFMDGLQLAAKVRESGSAVKIVILSAFVEFDYARRALPLQVEHYLLKPVEPGEFADVMKRVIGQCEAERSAAVAETRIRRAERPGASADEDPAIDKETARKAIEEVLRRIHRDYRLDMALETLAEQVYLSPNYLSRLFKKETGTSFVKYVTAYRLDKACELLRRTNMKIVDIATEVGYPNFSYFGSLFRQHYGTTPAKYREGDGL
ncbi:response regulator transcription factor [Paenibacillus cymbidii]|uniref:response regulator transcription factor n=1 Tax=Paenibacillus cymbidii TaxID=1639034 RepID=UPI001081C4BA|nr:helix-turn-helix domain-containing protein [Paenibacillus cymbidii]